MYAEDSFHTLSTIDQIGLVCLSVALSALTLLAGWRLMRGRHFAVRLVVAAALFTAFVWLSPQIYYTYYLTLFEIPWQIVIGAPPAPSILGRLLSFTGEANLSAHGQGLLGWALVLMALLRQALGEVGATAR